MASTLDRHLEVINARICAPGSPFETVTINRFGRDLPVFRNAPPCLPALFAHFCAEYDAREFLVDGEVRLTFGETYALAERAARGLIARHGVKPGDHVGIAARNSANWIIAYMAVLMAGGCATLLNGWWTGEELAEGIALAECTLVLADPARAARIGRNAHGAAIAQFDHGAPETGLVSILAAPDDAAPLPTPEPDDRATIVFTSGSTGFSKAAFSDHRGVVNATLSYASQSLMVYMQLAESGNTPAELQSTLVTLPLFHVTGEVPVLLQSFVIGRRLVMMPKWEAEDAMRLIEQERITYFVGVPLMSHEIATHPRQHAYDLTSCRSFAAGGSARPAEHVREIRERLPHAWALLGYGLTETNAVGCGNFNENHLAKPDSPGPATRPLVDLTILSPDGAPLPAGHTGEVAIRSVCNILGYWKNPKATADAIRPDGYLLTGDLGYLDEDGYLFIVDRKKDIIIRGGENIASIEVERAIYTHPAVAEASVFGVPHPRFGEVPVAVYHARHGCVLNEDELRRHVAARLAPFKVPERFWNEADALPRLGTEKIDKRALKARYSEQWESVIAGI